MGYAIAVIIGLVAGVALSYFYGKAVMADYQKAAAAAGMEFRKAQGVVALIKKAL